MAGEYYTLPVELEEGTIPSRQVAMAPSLAGCPRGHFVLASRAEITVPAGQGMLSTRWGRFRFARLLYNRLVDHRLEPEEVDAWERV